MSYTNISGVVVLAFFLGSKLVLAQDEPVDAMLDFEVPTGEPVADTPTESTPTPVAKAMDNLRFDFAFRLGSNKDLDINSHRFDSRLIWQGLLGKRLFTELDGKLVLRGPGDQQLEADQDVNAQLKLNKLSVQTNLGPLSAKLGFETITWGEMDTVGIVDVLSPWDYTENAFTAPEDARIGQALLSTDLYLKDTRLNVVFNPFPQTSLFPAGTAASLSTVDNEYELAARVKYNYGPGDVALYAARVVSDNPVLENFTTLTYPAYHMLAGSINIARGSFLWKSEGAYKKDLPLSPGTALKADVLQGALGFDYNPGNSHALTLEASAQYVLSDTAQLPGVQTLSTSVNLRWSKNFLHDTLMLVGFGSYQLDYGDIVAAMAVQYAINDYWKLQMNATLFEIPDTNSPQKLADDFDSINIGVSLSI
ncbi:MAG: hypothetical protein OEZ43_09245 [Gammaproteobacteria bacterium]|nr:hypothetical protein [Gammaproteobacteria bacterium]